MRRQELLQLHAEGRGARRNRSTFHLCPVDVFPRHQLVGAFKLIYRRHQGNRPMDHARCPCPQNAAGNVLARSLLHRRGIHLPLAVLGGDHGVMSLSLTGTAPSTGSFTVCKQDYRDELGFTDVLVAVVTIRYAAPPWLDATKGTSPTPGRPASSRRRAPTSSDPRRTRRVLRVAFFSDTDPFQIPPGELVSST